MCLGVPLIRKNIILIPKGKPLNYFKCYLKAFDVVVDVIQRAGNEGEKFG